MTVNEAAQFLLCRDRFAVLIHDNPDGDAVGAGYALCLALWGLGKSAVVFCGDPVPRRYSYFTAALPEQSFIPETILSADVASMGLLGDRIKEYATHVDLCIDHHPSNTGYAAQTLLDSGAAAACEIVYAVIKKMGAKITNPIAQALYTGISTDTGCFKFSNTTYQSHAITARLMRTGIDTAEINRLMFETKTRGRVEIERQILNRIEYYFGGRCAVIAVTLEMLEKTGAAQDELDGLTALPRMIEGVIAGVTLREKEGGRVKASVRTRKPLDSSKICGRLGGGGHKFAAGCEISGSLAEAKAKVLAIIEREIG
ncbi:MAG: bifunctional oligoribonuclease/PAP phosphatase NrnA [Oscillospiraceae bacterium]|jgi:phosphoesterase RecJ-like protein|nr:bifunctional oligoribonuclease/PAP phosphatase NrnA [Oscillospiraceae bacterium]